MPKGVYGLNYYIHIGKNMVLYFGGYLWENDIEMGGNIDIVIGANIYSHNGVRISSKSSIAGQCNIIDSNHGTFKSQFIQSYPMDTPNMVLTLDPTYEFPLNA